MFNELYLLELVQLTTHRQKADTSQPVCASFINSASLSWKGSKTSHPEQVTQTVFPSPKNLQPKIAKTNKSETRDNEGEGEANRKWEGCLEKNVGLGW